MIALAIIKRMNEFYLLQIRWTLVYMAITMKQWNARFYAICFSIFIRLPFFKSYNLVLKTLMKKQKRERSLTSKPKQIKQNPDLKTPLTSKKRLPNFKQNQHHKENKTMVQQGSFIVKSSKKKPLKPKERSKSLICDKKVVEPLTQQSHRVAFFDLNYKKPEKEETDFSAHLNSIRYDKPLFHSENFYNSFLLLGQQFPNVSSDVKEEEDLIKIKQLQQENKTFRVNISALKEEIGHFKLESQSVRQQNNGLKHRISSFELQASAQVCELKAKEIELTANHKKQQKSFQSKLNKLQMDLEKMIQQKGQTQNIIKVQQQNISQLERDKDHLKYEYDKEKQTNQILRKQKEEAVLRIINLQQQLQHFSQNLTHFDQLKKTYESKLTQLESQKQRIKKNACQLLQIVQNCRQH